MSSSATVAKRSRIRVQHKYPLHFHVICPVCSVPFVTVKHHLEERHPDFKIPDGFPTVGPRTPYFYAVQHRQQADALEAQMVGLNLVVTSDDVVSGNAPKKGKKRIPMAVIAQRKKAGQPLRPILPETPVNEKAVAMEMPSDFDSRKNERPEGLGKNVVEVPVRESNDIGPIHGAVLFDAVEFDLD